MKDKMNKIHHMDCLEFMKQVPDNYFDLVLTDPPYGINESGKTRKNQKSNKWNNPTKKVHNPKKWDSNIPSKEIFSEIKRVSKKQIIWGGNYFLEHLENTPCFLVWDKKNGDNDFADCELAWTNLSKAVRKISWLWNGFQKQEPEIRLHPTQKPLKVIEWCLSHGEFKTVFDPFMGSGTTAVACQSLGLEWCGCELEADYVAIANKRLEAVQGSLF